MTDTNIVKVEKIVSIYSVQVCGYTLDITATDKERCERIANDLRQKLNAAFHNGKTY